MHQRTRNEDCFAQGGKVFRVFCHTVSWLMSFEEIFKINHYLAIHVASVPMHGAPGGQKRATAALKQAGAPCVCSGYGSNSYTIHGPQVLVHESVFNDRATHLWVNLFVTTTAKSVFCSLRGVWFPQPEVAEQAAQPAFEQANKGLQKAGESRPLGSIESHPEKKYLHPWWLPLFGNPQDRFIPNRNGSFPIDQQEIGGGPQNESGFYLVSLRKDGHVKQRFGGFTLVEKGSQNLVAPSHPVP